MAQLHSKWNLTFLPPRDRSHFRNLREKTPHIAVRTTASFLGFRIWGLMFKLSWNQDFFRIHIFISFFTHSCGLFPVWISSNFLLHASTGEANVRESLSVAESDGTKLQDLAGLHRRACFNWRLFTLPENLGVSVLQLAIPVEVFWHVTASQPKPYLNIGLTKFSDTQILIKSLNWNMFTVVFQTSSACNTSSCPHHTLCVQTEGYILNSRGWLQVNTPTKINAHMLDLYCYAISTANPPAPKVPRCGSIASGYDDDPVSLVQLQLGGWHFQDRPAPKF